MLNFDVFGPRRCRYQLRAGSERKTHLTKVTSGGKIVENDGEIFKRKDFSVEIQENYVFGIYHQKTKKN